MGPWLSGWISTSWYLSRQVYQRANNGPHSHRHSWVCTVLRRCGLPLMTILSVQRDILQSLKMNQERIFHALHPFNRANLFYEVSFIPFPFIRLYWLVPCLRSDTFPLLSLSLRWQTYVNIYGTFIVSADRHHPALSIVERVWLAMRCPHTWGEEV